MAITLFAKAFSATKDEKSRKITGYRKNGEELLGWNFFQNDPEFAANTQIADAYTKCAKTIEQMWGLFGDPSNMEGMLERLLD